MRTASERGVAARVDMVYTVNVLGYTAALALHKRIGDDHDIVVIADRDKFVFIPSLIWLPFSSRVEKDITFELAPIYGRRNITFVHAAATRFDLDRHVV